MAESLNFIRHEHRATAFNPPRKPTSRPWGLVEPGLSLVLEERRPQGSGRQGTDGSLTFTVRLPCRSSLHSQEFSDTSEHDNPA